MYPKKLPNHTTETFRLEERLPDNTSIRKAYYHKDDYPINMHSHNFYEINIVVEGNGVHYIEDNLCLAKPGDVFAIPPKNRHGYWSENDLNIFHLLLPHYVLEKYSDELEKFSGYHTLFEIEPYIRKNYDESIFLHLTEEQLARLRPEMENILYDLQQEESEESNLIFEMRAILLICTLSRLIDTDYRMQLPDTTQPDALSIVKTIEYKRKEFSEKISIDDLARNMIRLSGFEPDVDIPIVYTGLRPGEKLYEELLLSGEGMQKTKNDLIYIGHEIAFDPAAFEENLMLLRAIPESDEPALRAKLRELVPTFHAPDGQTLPQNAAVG